ncbi:MAG TPA: response regulator transcription factor [Burkholderiaceae bacterium]|nr:response regulator transcription factor [Burkholderiaceae bacterium]
MTAGGDFIPRAVDAPRVLVIDANHDDAHALVQLVERDGIRAECVHAMQDGVRHVLASPPALVLLSIQSHERNGLDVLRALRACPEPPLVIVLTASPDARDAQPLLESGADDIASKPIDPRDLVARVRAALRRFEGSAASAPRFDFGVAVLDFTARTFKVGDVEIALSAIEFRLLVALARRPGVVLTRDALAQVARLNDYAPLERAVDVQIARLRKKLREASAEHPWIATVRRQGYAFIAPSPKSR